MYKLLVILFNILLYDRFNVLKCLKLFRFKDRLPCDCVFCFVYKF